MLAIRTILYPTDFSRPSEHAFQTACALAHDYGARLIVLHVHEPPLIYGELGALPPSPSEYRQWAGERVREFRLPDNTIKVDYLVREGNPAPEIVKQAKESNCDLIVMGTHGRTGVSRVLMGSVAEMVSRKAPCPVLTLKMPLPEKTVQAAKVEEPATS